MNTELPAAAVERDHELDQCADDALHALAAWRWRWTLDTTNAERVAIRAYARAVERDESTVRAHVRAYQSWRDDGAICGVSPRAFTDHLALARMGAETAAAADALAEKWGTSVEHVRRSHGYELKKTRERAHELAEESNALPADALAAAVARVPHAGAASRCMPHGELSPETQAELDAFTAGLRDAVERLTVADALTHASTLLQRATRLAAELTDDQLASEREEIAAKLATVEVDLTFARTALGLAVDTVDEEVRQLMDP